MQAQFEVLSVEFFGCCSAHLVGFQLYLCFLRAGNVQQMYSNELKLVDFLLNCE